MPKKIFTAPAPMLEEIIEKVCDLGFTATLGTPVGDEGVIVWIELDDPDEAAGLIELAAKAWEDY
jgi:hypothetical protein